MSKFDLTNIKYVELPSKGLFRYLRFSVDDKTYLAKTLKEAYRDKRQYGLLLKREFEAVTKLHSSYLPEYYELVDDDVLGRCIIEEFVEGRSLTDYLAEAHSEEEQDIVARQLMTALQTIHCRFMVHRNLKPSNILITKQGNNVKLLNLRPQFADEIQAPYTSTRYLAPEQKDETVAVDTRADIYSLGLILRQMNLPEKFALVIAKCCSLGRGDRYMYAEDVELALDARPSINLGRYFKVGGVLLAVVVIVGASVFAVKAAMDANSEAEPEEATSYVLPDSTNTGASASSTMQDTLKMISVSNVSATLVDSVKNVIAVRLESIYRPYDNDSIDQHTRKQIRRQVRNSYYAIMRNLGKVSPAERDAIDQYFAKYRQNKDAMLKCK